MKKQLCVMLLVLMTAVLCAVPALAEETMDTIVYENGDMYIGQLVNGQPNGKGVYVWADGSTYAGDFVNGQLDGKGVLSRADGSFYAGELTDGMCNGRGVHTWADGNTYAGDFVMDVRTGNGVFVWTNGTTVAGGFDGNAISGKAVVTWADGSSYAGDYDHDFRTGLGVQAWSDGKVYVGNFLDDYYEGYGVVYHADGSVLQAGLFDNGVLIEPMTDEPAEPAEQVRAALTADDVVGTWVNVGIRHNGTLISADTFKTNASMTFNADGTCDMMLNGDDYHDTWTIDPESGWIAMGSDLIPIVDGELLLADDTDSPIVFVRMEEPETAGIKEEDVLGVWTCSSVKVGDMVVTAKDVGIEATLEFLAGGSVALNFDGTTEYDTWEIADGMLLIHNYGVTLTDDGLCVTMDDGEITFVRADAE